MKSFLYWFFAVIITLSAVVYQRVTGPTNPKRVSFMLENREYKTKFTRSLETHVTLDDASKGNFGDFVSDVEFQIDSFPKEAIITIKYRRYPGEDTLKSVTDRKSVG